MRVVLTSAKNEKLEITVVPRDLEIPGRIYENETFPTLKGPITLMGNRIQREMDLNSFFPKKGERYSLVARETPETCIKKLQKWIDSGQPFRITVLSGMAELLNMRCTASSFNYRFDAVGRAHYALSLKEFL
jgi:hypothetical protein